MYLQRATRVAAFGLIASTLLSGCDPRPATPLATPTPFSVADLPDCLTDETRALGMGLTKYEDEAEAKAALANSMLFPDPSTLPEGSVFNQAYFNLAEQGPFKQSTLGLIYLIGDQSEGERSVSILYFNQGRAFVEPPEPHENTTVRGGKTAYAFEPPFREGLHSLQWQEDCRLVSVIADLPADQVRRIAEGLDFPAARAGN